ncbi:MOSC domain-containing protein [Rhizobium halophilum]|uniref:MOSC domain-containing protein n=1 Tax=Rhizobium halophilum TaxID=2846852 RepID=UPI001EFCCDC5|nr:MOSC domain-containing protein [Rhizobium halophilum]MCF6370648.1 MOSC domain-containing protein [Rhizobium halophilum]
MHIAALNLYPLKSGRGIALDEAAVGPEGIPGDRRMMLVDLEGNFITQRDFPVLARLDVRLAEGSVRLAFDGADEIVVMQPPAERRTDVVIWKSPVSAAVADDAINRKITGWLGRKARLVFFDEQSQREASREWAGEGTPVTFADGYQILVTTTASLAALNADMVAHGEGEVGMDRFRPNIVLATNEAWAEDGWGTIEIGTLILDLVKPCTRCIMTTQDQRTGSREVASPMPAMGRIRMSADRRVPGPLFGWNAVPRTAGRISVGDDVKVRAMREAPWAIKRR